MIDDTVCCHGRPITCMECIADERAERDNKWREAFNRSEQFQTGPIERAERAESALRDISELLSDAGCQAQPIGSAVIELRERAESAERQHARLKKALTGLAITGVTAGANPLRGGGMSPPLWHEHCALCGMRWTVQQWKEPIDMHPPNDGKCLLEQGGAR